MTFFLFLWAALAVPVIFISLYAPADIMTAMLVPGITSYGTAFALDVRSTVRHGRHTVERCESSPVMRWAVRRFGLAGAVPVQLIVEITIVLALSLLFTHSISPNMLCAVFVMIALFHVLGWRKNSR